MLEDFLAFVVLYNYVIPISLYVTVGKSLCERLCVCPSIHPSVRPSVRLHEEKLTCVSMIMDFKHI